MQGIMSDLQFNVGGFTISMYCPGNDGDVMLPNAYRHFLSEKAPDVFLKVHPDRVFFYRRREKIFHSGPNWRLYRSGEKYIVRTMFQEGIFDPDFRSGDLYALRKRGGFFNFQYFHQFRGAHTCGPDHRMRWDRIAVFECYLFPVKSGDFHS